MKEVSKKKPRSSQNRVLSLLLALLFLGGAAFAWQYFTKKSAVKTIDKELSVKTLYSHTTDEIKKITVTKRGEAPYTLLYSDETLTVEGNEDFIVSSALYEDILACASVIEIQDTLADTLTDADCADLSLFSLDPPEITVDVWYTDDTSVTFYVGDLLPEETPLYYFMLKNDSLLYCVSQDVHDAYAYSASSLHEVYDPSLNPDLIDKITITGEVNFTAELRDDGWHMTSPYHYPLSQTAMDTLLSNIKNMRFANYIGTADALDLNEYGLDAPRLNVSFLIAQSTVSGTNDAGEEVSYSLPEYTLNFSFGADAREGITLYCLYGGRVQTGSYFTTGFFFDIVPENMLQKNPFNYETNALATLTTTRSGKTTAYSLRLVEQIQENNAFAYDEDGNQLYDVKVSANGADVDALAFLRDYYALVSMTPAGTLPDDYTPDAPPETTIMLSQSAAVFRTVSFYRYDALHSALSVDGVMKYYVSDTWDDSFEILFK